MASLCFIIADPQTLETLALSRYNFSPDFPSHIVAGIRTRIDPSKCVAAGLSSPFHEKPPEKEKDALAKKSD